MPRDQAGVAAGVASTTRQLGSALGVAIIAACGLAMVSVGALSTGEWGRRRAKANAARMEAVATRFEEDRAPALS